MDFRRPLHTVAPTIDSEVLGLLAKSERPLSRREVADLVNDRSKSGITNVLRRLSDQGTLLGKRIGTQFSYTINRAHIMYPAIHALANPLDALTAWIRDQAKDWQWITFIEIVGEVPTPAANPSSMIEVRIGTPTMADPHGPDPEEGGGELTRFERQLEEFRTRMELATGNPCKMHHTNGPAILELPSEYYHSVFKSRVEARAAA